MIVTTVQPQDKALRHLDVALRCDRIQPFLQEALDETLGLQIDSCRIERVKYKPGKNCLVCYRLQIKDGESSNSLIVTARFYPPNGSHSRYIKARKTLSQDTGSGTALMHLPAIDCLVWLFPYDRKLRSLPQLIDQNIIHNQILAPQVPKIWGPSWRAVATKPTAVHYVPEHTFCLRAELTLEHATSGQRKSQTLYGKTYYNHQGAEAFSAMCQLWGSELRRNGCLRIPEPICYLPRYKTLWQEEVPGVSLLEQRRNDSYIDRIHDTGRIVATLHNSDILLAKEQTCQQLFRRMEGVLELASNVHDANLTSLSSMIEQLTSTRAKHFSGPTVVLHGDLHLKNILCDGQQVYLIDLDTLCHGNPLLDLGSFIASVLYLEKLGIFETAFAEKIISAFLFAYQGQVNWSISIASLRWHIAAALISERISRLITRQKAGRLEILNDLIELAVEIGTASDMPRWLRNFAMSYKRISSVPAEARMKRAMS